jgi:hypothetical protein
MSAVVSTSRLESDLPDLRIPKVPGRTTKGHNLSFTDLSWQ